MATLRVPLELSLLVLPPSNFAYINLTAIYIRYSITIKRLPAGSSLEHIGGLQSSWLCPLKAVCGISIGLPRRWNVTQAWSIVHRMFSAQSSPDALTAAVTQADQGHGRLLHPHRHGGAAAQQERADAAWGNRGENVPSLRPASAPDAPSSVP